MGSLSRKKPARYKCKKSTRLRLCGHELSNRKNTVSFEGGVSAILTNWDTVVGIGSSGKKRVVNIVNDGECGSLSL